MEKFTLPTSGDGEPKGEKMVERKSPNHPGYERGWIYTQFPLSKLDEHEGHTYELETQSGNVYTIRILQTVTPEAPRDARYSMTNKKTGKTTFLSEADLHRTVRVGESFEWSGGSTTPIRSILRYDKGKTYFDKLSK